MLVLAVLVPALLAVALAGRRPVPRQSIPSALEATAP